MATTAPGNNIQAPVFPGSGEFFMNMSIGTLVGLMSAILDTGSNLIWTQCMPCTKCFDQPTPVFDTMKSLTCSNVLYIGDLCQDTNAFKCMDDLQPHQRATPLSTEVYAPPHRSACTFSPRCPAPLTRVPHTPTRGVPQSTSLCESSWLYLSSLVHKTGEITATDQIENERDSFRRRRALHYTASQNRLGLLPLSFSMDILHWLHHSCLDRLLHISQSISMHSCTAPDPPSTFALALRASVQRLLPLSILLINTTGPMSDSSSPCLDTPLQSV
ncbi:hypothetical protein Acr_11g0009480 [Actinidia rufa]|uniref:Xylanase inhibitor N-terminal domain-containing protein n=1 Tax=Actinidia rufa TaxID=165716 RepID=A0A7J0FD75_9ERIC|nr:hypothetical protein Acr_11g0009480 [Actinidia rufa]